jgi:hypothetical protein
MGGVAFTPATNYYFGLSTTTINSDGTGATEPSTGAYARVLLANTKSSWTTASSGTLTNSAAVTFAESTASWGTITYVGMWDALTGGNLWWYDVLSPSRTVASATTVLFAIGSITVQFNNT